MSIFFFYLSIFIFISIFIFTSYRSLQLVFGIVLGISFSYIKRISFFNMFLPYVKALSSFFLFIFSILFFFEFLDRIFYLNFLFLEDNDSLKSSGFDFAVGIYNLDLFLILPEIFFFFSILFSFLIILLFDFENKFNFIFFNFVCVYLIVLILLINQTDINFFVLYGTISSNVFIWKMKIFIITLALLFQFLIYYYLFINNLKLIEYFIILSLIIFGLLLLIGNNDFIGFFLCLELVTLSLYLLSAYRTNSNYSAEAGIKYFILGALGSGIILFGISLLYGFTGTTNFSDLSQINSFIFLAENSGDFELPQRTPDVEHNEAYDFFIAQQKLTPIVCITANTCQPVHPTLIDPVYSKYLVDLEDIIRDYCYYKYNFVF